MYGMIGTVGPGFFCFAQGRRRFLSALSIHGALFMYGSSNT